MKIKFRNIIILFTACLLGVAMISLSQSTSALYEQGLLKENAEGDLAGAITIFNRVVEDKAADALIRARAQLHIGLCYEKLGQNNAKQAQAAFQKVIDNFPGQQDAVKEAREQLSALGTESQQAAGVTIRKLGPFGDDMSRIVPSSVSADGRYLGASHFGTGNAAIVDLVAGKEWDATDYGNIGAAEFVLVSPDGKRLAFTRSFARKGSDIIIVGSDGTGERVLLESDDIGGWGRCLAWSPDGKYLAVYEEKGGPYPHVLVSVDGGEVRDIETSFGYIESLGFSPDGRFLAYSPAAVVGDGPQQSDVYIQPISGGQEIAIAAHPANDMFIGWAPNGDILFTSGRAGSIGLYGVAVEDGRQSGEPRLLKANMDIGEPLGITNAGSLYYAADRTIRNAFFASIDFSTGRVLSEPEKISDRFDDSTSMPSWSPDGRYLSYLVHRPGDATSAVMIREIASDEERELLPDAVVFPDMSRIRWHADGKSLLALGRKDNVTGLLRINAATGEVSVVTPVEWTGISTHTTEWTPDAKWLFRCESPVRPLIIRRNVETGEEQTIYSPEDSEDRSSRGYRVSPDGKFLLLVQRLALAQESALRVVPTSGGEYRDVFTGRSPNYEGFGLSRAWTNESTRVGSGSYRQKAARHGQPRSSCRRPAV